MRGGSKEASSARLLREPYRNPNQEAERRSKCPRPPRSRRSTLLAYSGLTDAHACLAPAGPDTLPGQARLPSPSGSCDSPGAAPDHLPGRARSAADLSPALPASAARISPRSGEFCRPTPLARKRPPKRPSCCRRSPLAIARVCGSKCWSGVAEALTLCGARKAVRKRLTFVAHHSAGMPCSLPSHQA